MKEPKTTSTIGFRIEEDLRRDFERVIDDLGLSITSAFTVFAKAVVKSNTIPIDLIVDPFYRKENQDELERRIDLFETGKTQGKQMVKTIDELEAIVNGNQNSNI